MVRLTDRPDMTLDVYHGRNTTTTSRETNRKSQKLLPLTQYYPETRKRVIGKQYQDQMPHNVASDQGLHCLLTGFSIKNRIKRCRPSVPRRVKCQYVVNMSITCMLKKCHQRDGKIPSLPPSQSPSPDQTQHGPF